MTFLVRLSHFLSFLLLVLAVAVCRAQVQHELWAETAEGTGINITCSHPNIQSNDYIYWYRHLPGRGPAFLVFGTRGSKALTDLPGRLEVAADRRSSALWLTKPRLRDAAVYYCALRATGRGAGAAAVQEPWRAGPGVCGGGEAGAQPPGGAAAPPARTTSSRSRGGSPASPAPPRHFGSAERVWSLGAAGRSWQQPGRGVCREEALKHSPFLLSPSFPHAATITLYLCQPQAQKSGKVEMSMRKSLRVQVLGLRKAAAGLGASGHPRAAWGHANFLLSLH